MNTFIPTIKSNYLTYCVYIFILINTINLNAQVFPPDTNLTNGSYSPPSSLPGYLVTQTDENFGNNITRVSDVSAFGGMNISIRHAYAKRQVWNSDQSYIILAGNSPKILDGTTFDLITTVPSFGNMGWSNTNRLMSFFTSASNNVFQKRMLNESNYTISTVFTKTFSNYNVMSHWGNECNVSADDKYVALYGTRPGSSMCWVVVYDIEMDVVISETNLNTPLSNVNWASISQGGGFVLVQYNSIGSGSTQGTKSYDRNMNLIDHLTNRNPHGDMGFDQFGNEVWVSNDANQIRSKRLDGVGNEIQYAYVSGGHVSCRNINRPGWAYVNDHGASSNPNDYASFREVFAVKLDGKPGGQTTVQRFSKHYSNINPGYYHQPQAVASPDGTKVLFASNMDMSSVESQSYPFTWVVEAPQDANINQVVASDDAAICDGQNITLTASGADSYEWMPGNINGASIDVNPTGDTTYTVTGTHSDGSTSTDDVLITVNPIPVANAGNDVETCVGTAVTLSANASDGYLWSTGATTQSISVSPNTTTTYSVEVTQNGCTSAADDVVVTVNTLPNVDAGLDISINYGDSTVLTANGADSYQWNTGQTTQSITVNPTIETTYTVTGTSGTCQNSDSVTVFLIGSEVVANAGNDQTICNGSQTILTATGGAAYAWNTGQTTESIDVSPSTTTTYTVTVFDSTGTVSDSDDVTVFVNASPTVDAGIDVTIDEGESTLLTASGADAYQWSTGETTQSITVNPSNTTIYSVTGTSNGCDNNDDVIVTVNVEQVTANAGPDVTICEDENTILTASGGTTYQWSTGATTQSIEVGPNTTTTYTVTVFNSFGTYSDSDDVIVSVDTLPNVDAGFDVTISEGENTILTATGADAYQWNTGETTQSITVNPSSTTTYTVTGFSNSCDVTDDVTVTVETELVNANAGLDVSICEGESTTLTATGGSTYEWNTGETTASIDVNPNTTTTYTVTAFNTLGTNSDVDDVIVTVNALPIIDAGADVTISEGESISLTATGGSGYEWNTGETIQTIEVSPTTTTTYTVTGWANGCSSTDQVTVTVITENVIANAGADQTICEGESIMLTATGGSTYEWNTGETTASIEVNPSTTTTYTVTAFNTLGTDSDADDVIVTVNALPSVDAGSDVTISEDENTTLTATGADSYEWSTGETTQSIIVNPSSTTVYSVTGFLNGCEANSEVTVTVETEFVNANAGLDITICEGESTTLTATGGTTYQWSTGETTASIEVTPNTTTTYTVTAFNTLGTNSNSDDVTVEVNPIPIADAGNDVEICQSNSVTLTAAGGTSYLWSTGETTQTITVTPNATATYLVEVIQNNCSSTDQVTVTVNTLPNVNAGLDVSIFEGESTTLTATGADSYEWSTGETTQSITVNPMTTTVYSVTGFLNGCEANSEVTVIVNPIVFVADAGEDQSICEGTTTTLTASEGDAYLWNTGETTQSINVSPWASETYTVTVFEDGEQAEDDVTVYVDLNPNVVIMNGDDVTILEGEFITLSATGANNYEWDNGATQPNIAVSPSTSRTYSVTGYVNNCSDEKSITVNVLETVEAYAGEDQTICSSDVVTLTADGGVNGEVEYLWSNGETTQSIQVAPGTDTEYSVVVYNALTADESTVMVFVNDCSPEEIPEVSAEFDVLVFQDVSTDVLKLQISGMDRVDVKQIMIYDLTGKVIYREQITTNNELQTTLDKEINTSLFSRGVYVVRLIYDDTEMLKKIPIR